MVTPAKRAVLPHQPSREALELQGAVEDKRRAEQAAGRERLIAYTKPADSGPTVASDDVVHNATGRLRLSRASLIADTNSAANATNYATLKLYYFDPRGSLTQITVGTMATNQVGFSKGLPRDFELQHTEVPAGYTLAISGAKSGSGVQLPQMRLIIEAQESAS